MHEMNYVFTAEIWVYASEKAAWHFVHVPEELSAEIRMLHGQFKRGWGSIPVLVRIGETQWKTSIFPDNSSQCYLLPLKAEIRKKESLREAMQIAVQIIPRS
jgi:hypothetical protein